MNRLGKHLAIWGSALQLGPVVGVGVTVVLMMRTFAGIAQSSNPKPGDLASGISTALIFTAAGMVVSLVGFVRFSSVRGTRSDRAD